MRVFLAGASGALGRRLVPLLREAGHEVSGTTRSPQKAAQLRELGAEPVIVDATDTDALARAVAEAKPEVVVNQLTALPGAIDFRDAGYLDQTNHPRGTVGPALAAAAAAAGATRLVSQSIAFNYLPRGDWVKNEDDPLLPSDGPPPFGAGVAAVRELERSTLETVGVAGLVLRYGWFYGPGTYYASDGSSAAEVRRRRFPIVGSGDGVFSFIHVDDAAAATVAAIERGEAGIYNVTDDDPAPMRDWIPVYAEALGAKPPRRVPAWLARLIAGKQAAQMATALRGASNEKAKRELRWQPRHASWRQGFRDALG